MILRGRAATVVEDRVAFLVESELFLGQVRCRPVEKCSPIKIVVFAVAQDKRSTNQNSGVRIDGTNPNGNIQIYYGCIEDIWELDYTPNFKVPLFWCQWVKLTGGGVTVDKEYEMITVDLNNIGYKDKPFVLAADVSQMFYVKDMSIKSKRGKTKTSTQ